ncbi:hypothetical protein [Methanogenium organophilum]|uniref:Uncharacterized protein n=1 Tax=Methanogenium organophilum TaxID=2199 RepID=A0A9X9S3J0_METOG|nr:hypothetical protein [Methanogenium organophilum]WAI00260.1 hypothetical protein OU421_07405 [Methanogenium organophilum]
MISRFIISVIVSLVLISCAFVPASAGNGVSGLSFSLEEVAGAENEYLLSCDGADGGPVGISISFPGPANIVSTTLSESRYQMNGNTLFYALVDEDACSFRIICADLQPGTLSLSWEEFADGVSGETVITVSDAGEVSVSASGNSGVEDDANQPSATVTQSPFVGIAFTVIVAFAVVDVYSRRREEGSQ